LHVEREANAALEQRACLFVAGRLLILVHRAEEVDEASERHEIPAIPMRAVSR
jgi:hypothetical protein